jgi:uncharacterized RDD family membrane protein YckC
MAAIENPFPGLRPFREDEEHLFFGRENQVDRMVDKLAATRFLAVVGTSGSGKSSLVNCGLKPALHRGLMAGAGTSWHMVQFRPGGSPMRSMARAFADGGFLCGCKPEGLSLFEIVQATLNMSSLGLADLFEYAHLAPGTNLLVVVDQFEEIFRYGKMGTQSNDFYGVSGEAIAFVNLLLEAHAQQQYRIYIVLTMRSDFLGECSQFDGLPEVINEGQYLVPRLTREERREAIGEPIRVAQSDLSPVLLTRLVNDVGDNPDQLSILQHAVNRTWSWWQQVEDGLGILSLEQYESVGTMAHALDRHAEEAFANLKTPRQQLICEKVFRALTDKGTDARGIRRPMPLHLLCDVIAVGPEEVLPVLDVFREPTRSFLMPPLAEPVEPDTVIDISHEILMRVWDRLKKWTVKEAQSANTYRRLAETAELRAAGEAALWRDPDLQTALEWQWREKPNAIWAQLYRGGYETALSFLAASKQVRDSERAEAEFERRWRKVTPFLRVFTFLVFAILFLRTSESLAPKLLPSIKKIIKPLVAQSLNTFDAVVVPTSNGLPPVPNAMPSAAKKAAPNAMLHPNAKEGVKKDQDSVEPDQAELYRRERERVNSREQRDLAESLDYVVFGCACAAICFLGYSGISWGGKRLYRHFAFAGIAARIEGTLPARVQIKAPSAPSSKRPQEVLFAPAQPLVNLVFATFWRRLSAGLIDLAIFVLIGCLAFLLAVIADLILKAQSNTDLISTIFLLSLPVLDYLYQSLMTTSRWGGTLGELACGIQVTTRAGQRPGFGRISGRYLAKGISWLPLGLGFPVQLFTPKRQALHDLIAGTVVIRRHADAMVRDPG